MRWRRTAAAAWAPDPGEARFPIQSRRCKGIIIQCAGVGVDGGSVVGGLGGVRDKKESDMATLKHARNRMPTDLTT